MHNQTVHRWYTRPVLFVADVNRALRFYVENLGFEKRWHEGDGSGTVCQVNRGECEIILCQDAARRGTARLFVELTADGLTELRRELIERSVPSKEAWWGSDVLQIVDPDGNELLFPRVSMPMEDERSLDSLFRVAVGAIDAGNIPLLESLLTQHPELVRGRLESPGLWLSAKAGKALDDFFRQPYLLWFVAEDPIRNGTLPSNIAQAARAIIEAARRERVEALQEQLDYALQLVCWSTVAPSSGVQLDLIDVMIDAGASTDGASDNALVNGNLAAAGHLVKRGAALTLATALCLELWEDAARIAQSAAPGEKQFALVLCALRGNAGAVRRAVAFGADVNAPSERLFSHATPLHHAASSGSFETVKALVEAGARLDATDTVYNGTPLGWAEYGKHANIAAFLRDKMERPSY